MQIISVNNLYKTGDENSTMDEMAIERLGYKNPYQSLLIELKEEYGMSPVEAKALIKKVQEFIEAITVVKGKITR